MDIDIEETANNDGADATDSASNIIPLFIYTGEEGVEVPRNVTHIRVDPSVTVIPDETFQGCTELVKIDLPEGLLTIGKYAFEGCGFQDINIPSTVTTINQSAFRACKLVKVELPTGLQQLSVSVFSDCSFLEWVKLPPIRDISNCMFDNCKRLEHVIFSDGIESIGIYAFGGCESLEQIELPSTLKSIGKFAFRNCHRLSQMDLPDSLERIGEKAFRQCMFRNMRIPPGVTELDMSTIHGCDGFTFSMELPERLKLIYEPEYSPEMFIPEGLQCMLNLTIPSKCKHPSWLFDNIRVGAFPTFNCSLVDAFKNRFDALPIHKLCYYQSYYPPAQVVGMLKREIDPRAENSRALRSKFNTSGNEGDWQGLTPLHILACSTTHNVELYQVLIKNYPSNIIETDKYDKEPLYYALWGNAPVEVIMLLATSQKELFPKSSINWETLIPFLAQGGIQLPLERINILLNMQQKLFPNDDINWRKIVEIRDSPPDSNTFNCILQHSLSRRLESLGVTQWKGEILAECIRLSTTYVTEERLDMLYSKLSLYENLKESATLLELALWKAEIDKQPTHHGRRLRHKSARADISLEVKKCCHVNCGADIIIPNVLQYLFPVVAPLYPSSSDEDSNGSSSEGEDESSDDEGEGNDGCVIS